ncbi:MAG: class I SAM-dependent methyltransferase [Anaerolineae bacterium]|nr:class I SAM-dependent methyltransferase [Anaerolineae bacterium]
MTDSRERLFDRWAENYDRGMSVNDDAFPFDGYERILDAVVELAGMQVGMQSHSMRVLDLGTGTGNLAQRFIQRGCEVWGLDFSAEMLSKAQEKFPQAHFFRANLLEEWPSSLRPPYDCIVSAYVLHEFNLEAKIAVLRRAMQYLAPNAPLLIADVAFESVADREALHQRYAPDWDEDEFYWAADEAIAAGERAGLRLTYRQLSSCGGIFIVERL